MLGQAIGVTGQAVATFGVLVEPVLGIENSLCLFDGAIELDPIMACPSLASFMHNEAIARYQSRTNGVSGQCQTHAANWRRRLLFPGEVQTYLRPVQPSNAGLVG